MKMKRKENRKEGREEKKEGKRTVNHNSTLTEMLVGWNDEYKCF